MALLESAAAAAAAPAADAEGGISTGAGTETTRSSGRVDDSAGGSGWSAFRWPKRGAAAADIGIPPGTRGASVRALTAVSVAVVPAAHFHAVCAAHPEVRLHARHVPEGQHRPIQQWCRLKQGALRCSRCTCGVDKQVDKVDKHVAVWQTCLGQLQIQDDVLDTVALRCNGPMLWTNAGAFAAPQVRQQVQEGAWARRSENTVLTALVRLAALHEPLRTALTSQVTQQSLSPVTRATLPAMSLGLVVCCCTQRLPASSLFEHLLSGSTTLAFSCSASRGV